MVSAVLDDSENQDMYDEDEQNSQDESYSENSGSVYDEAEEEVKQAPSSDKKRRQGPINMNKLSDAEVQELFCKEIDILLAVAEIIKSFKNEVPLSPPSSAQDKKRIAKTSKPIKKQRK